MPDEMADIVVVDDNDVLLSFVDHSRGIRRVAGYTVRTAADGFAALVEIRKRAPDILVSDLNMPRMSGFELLSVVRRRFPQIVVIAMSGGYSGATVLPAIPADAFYAKGTCRLAELFQMVKAMDNRQDVLEARATAPIWVQGIPIAYSSISGVLVSCPECLRAFSQFLPAVNVFGWERQCPHCLESVHLAIVPPEREPDMSLFPASGSYHSSKQIAIMPC